METRKQEHQPVDYARLFDSFSKKTIMVVGDVMLDEYVFGKVERISPEAPVPVVDVGKREIRMGGAANVALNIAAMGARPVLCGVVGNDAGGRKFLDLLRDKSIDSRYMYPCEDICTTTKLRIIGNNVQLLRVDEEKVDAMSLASTEAFKQLCIEALERETVDALVFEDYDKGALTPDLIASLVAKAHQKGIPTLVDPKKRNFHAYKNVTLFKPNLKEFRDGIRLFDPMTYDRLNRLSDIREDLLPAAASLRKELNCRSVMITLSEQGMVLHSEEESVHVPAAIRHVADVSGAGDTVISLSALCLASSLPWEEVARISNAAGGSVCECVGVVPVDRQRLLEELQNNR